MNYEEKYKRAFDIAKEVYHDHRKDRYWRDWLTKLFPELAESEDERIRKGLIEAVSGILKGNKLFGTDVTREEALAWLEKQGEKDKPKEWCAEDEQNLNVVLSFIPDECLRRWLKDKLSYDLNNKLDADKVIAWIVANICDFEYYVKWFKKDFGL